MYSSHVFSEALPPDIWDYDQLAREASRALRGSRTQVTASRALGYRSNIVHRWETGACMPTAARFLQACLLFTGNADAAQRFLGRPLRWSDQTEFASPQGVALFLRELAGKTTVQEIAAQLGISRYRVARVLAGRAEPKLPFFLQLVQVLSRRVLDLLALFVRVERLPSVAHLWRQLEVARRMAYELPWSHAVLRALELEPRAIWKSSRWLAARIGLSVTEVRRALDELVAAGQVTRRGLRYRLRAATTIDTSRDVERARKLRLDWCKFAVERLERGQAGYFGYSLFAVSREDLERLREIHAQYLKAMQNVIAASQQLECVGLFCSQLLDLRAGEDNALGDASQRIA